MPLSVSAVPGESVDLVFDRLSEMIERAVTHGAGDAASSEGIRAAVKRGDMLAWVVHDGQEIVACVVLSVRRYQAKTTLFVEIAAGSRLSEWVDRVERLLKDYRDLVGADTIEALCRDGMTRKLSQRWRRKATLMELK